MSAPSYNDKLLDPALIKLGFAEVDTSVDYRVVVSTTAGEKCGKTHWAFTAPGPIGAISTDTGTEEVARTFIRQGKRILISSFKSADELKHGDSDASQKAYEAEWKRMSDAILAIIANTKMRTLIVDTATEAWELCRLARFGKLSQVMPQKYVEVNSEFRALIKAAYERRGLNCIWIHKVKKEYKTLSGGKDGWTGKMERAGFGDMPFLVDVNLRHYFDREVGAFGVEVLDSRINMLSAVGSKLEGDMCNFQMFAEALFPDSVDVPGVWE